jgi:hypothetical protein
MTLEIRISGMAFESLYTSSPMVMNAAPCKTRGLAAGRRLPPKSFAPLSPL